MRDRRMDWTGSCRTGAGLCLFWVAAFTLPGVASPGALNAQQPLAEPPPVVENGGMLRQYRAYRWMHAKNERFDQEAWLEAWTEFDGHTFRYEIVREHGSKSILERVLRKVLEREQELIAEGGMSRAELSPENYDFLEAAGPGTDVRYVLLKPKRKDILLVDGRMVLDPSGAELLRVEGRLAKNPSFWTSLVNIIRDFAHVNGANVPVVTESIAKIKLAGMSRMTVRYRYESVNGRPVNASARRAIAAAVARDMP